jgi:hypothetical protein
MPDPIETFYRNGYVDFIRLQAMYMDSALSDTVDFEPQQGVAMFLDSYGQPTLTERLTRNVENQPAEVPRARRQIAPRFWEFTEYFDPRDRVRLLRAIRPDSQFARSVLGAFQLQKDTLIEAAFDGSATDDAGSPIVFGAGQTVDDAFKTVTSLTVDKIIEATRILRAGNTQRMNNPWHIALHPNQLAQVLFASSTDERISSFDFNQLRPLESGEVVFFMGLWWHVSTVIGTGTFGGGPGHYAYVYSQDSMVLAMDGDIEVHFDIIPELGHALQVAHYATMNATRMHEAKIVRIECVD